jgi:hypothetical protein
MALLIPLLTTLLADLATTAMRTDSMEAMARVAASVVTASIAENQGKFPSLLSLEKMLILPQTLQAELRGASKASPMLQL